MKRRSMLPEEPSYRAHLDDGIWYCDAHGTADCEKCKRSQGVRDYRTIATCGGGDQPGKRKDGKR